MKELLEGLREGDLADLVLPLISVDEWQSLMDPSECIVFGFYVHDEDAAKDLNRFLQKSAIPILDTKVSPAPDQHGYYMVFLELMNNDRLPELITDVLAEVKNLVDLDHWQMRVRKHKKLIPFSEESLKEVLKDLKETSVKESILEFFETSALWNIQFEDDIIVLQGSRERHVFEMACFDRMENILEIQQLTESPLSVDIRTVAKLNRIRRSLGEGWDVSKIGRFILLQQDDDPRGLLLKATI